MRRFKNCGRFGIESVSRRRCRCMLRGRGLGREFLPAELLNYRIGSSNNNPVVDGTGGAWPDTGHAELTDVKIDNVVGFVMADGTSRASRFAGVAPDADLRIDQMLLCPL